MISICAWVIGVAVGFVLAVVASNRIDARAADEGVIKLAGKLYRLTKIE